MGAVALLRELWHRRLLVAVVALVAVLAATLMAYHVGPSGVSSRQHHVGIASTAALVDTPSSQAVDLGGKESADGATLPGRATLLASLLTSAPLKDEIARAAGI